MNNENMFYLRTNQLKVLKVKNPTSFAHLSSNFRTLRGIFIFQIFHFSHFLIVPCFSCFLVVFTFSKNENDINKKEIDGKIN